MAMVMDLVMVMAMATVMEMTNEIATCLILAMVYQIRQQLQCQQK